MDGIETCISFLLGKAAQRVSRRAKELLAQHNVTPVQYAAVCVLAERDGQTSAEVGQRLVIDSATMTGIIDRLERDGLVTRQADKDDRRATRLYLTAQAKKLYPRLDAAMTALNREVDQLLSRDAARFRDMLRRVGDSARP